MKSIPQKWAVLIGTTGLPAGWIPSKFQTGTWQTSLHPAFNMEHKLKMLSVIALRTKCLYGNMNISNLSSLCYIC